MRSVAAWIVLVGLSGCGSDPAPPPPPATPPPVLPPQTGAGPTVGPRIELDLAGATVTEVAEALARATARPVAIDPHAQELATCARLTVISGGPTSADDAVAIVGRALEGSGLALEQGPSGAVVRRQPNVDPPEGCREQVAATTSSESSTAPETTRPSAAVTDGIRQVNGTTFLITRDARDAFLEDQSTLMRTVRIVPHVENGAVQGLKLYGIRRASAVGMLGLQNGDLVRTISGYDVSSPERALEAYARLRHAPTLEVQVERRGQPVTLTYRFVDRLPPAREQTR